MPKPKERVLEKLLLVLAEEWGHDNIARVLQKIQSQKTVGSSLGNSNLVTERKRVETFRPSPTDLVMKLDLPDARKAILLEVARQFEDKRFLPSISDIRNFLEIRGIPARGIKQRPDAFRQVLQVLRESSPDRLDRIVRDSRLTGPSQLGPISDAIRSTSAAMRSSGSQNARDEIGEALPQGEGETLPRSRDDLKADTTDGNT